MKFDVIGWSFENNHLIYQNWYQISSECLFYSSFMLILIHRKTIAKNEKDKNNANFVILLFQNALNCWIAACIYVLTLVVSGQQFYANSRTTA